MASPCQVVPTADQFVTGMVRYLDCQAQMLGAQGYTALAAPGSSASLLLGVMLTLFIAMFGYRMLMGETPSLREGVLAFVKIGIVLAFATSWPAYQTVIYDVVLRTPGELASEIGGPAGLPGASGGLPARLDGVDQAFRTLSIYGVGAPVDRVPPSEAQVPPWAGFDTFAIGSSRLVFLASAIGGFALVRLAAGLLLALGPLFFLFLLFDGTRGLFVTWLRALIGVALGSLAIAVLLGVELALLEPWLTDLVTRRQGGDFIIGVPATLLATAIVFAGVLAGTMLIMMRVASGLRLMQREYLTSTRRMHASVPAERLPVGSSTSAHVANENRSRAAAIADGVAATQRREEQAIGGSQAGATVASGATRQAVGSTASAANAPIGQAFRRRTSTRVSATSRNRDRHR